MGSVDYRTTRPGDEEQLKAIWQQAFLEDEVTTELYFQTLYRPGDGVAAVEDGTLLSAIYLMEDFTVFIPGQENKRCTYLYALGTSPQQRGRGLGGNTIREAGREGYRRGADLVCFIPATESLSLWYRRILNTEPAFFCRRFPVTAGEHPGYAVSPLSANEYAALREGLLADTPHVSPSPKTLELQALYCRYSGGGLYRIDTENSFAIAAADVWEGSLCVKELLCPAGDPIPVARALLARFGLSEAKVKTPVFWHDGLGAVEVDCVLIPGGDKIQTEKRAYWGLSIE